MTFHRLEYRLNHKANISHIPSKLLTDSTFLNFLHSHVPAVTKPMKDVSSGTDQLLVEPREGVGGNRGAVEDRGGEGGDACIEECKEVPCDC